MIKFYIFLLISFSLSAKSGYFEPWGKDADIAKKKEKIADQKSSIFTL